MKEKVIIEVGSTVTKVDYYDGKDVKHLEDIVILFKKNYQEHNHLVESDISLLIDAVDKYVSKYSNVYVCGTSVFRSLPEQEKERFLSYFKEKTGISFAIISAEEENRLTVLGATRGIKESVAVFVGGGGSTEIAIYDEGIKEMVNSSFGVMDIMRLFPDLKEDIATTSLEDVKKVIRENLNLPKEKVDVLLLSGGGHLHYALLSGIRYEKNTLYENSLQPVMMDIKTRTEDTYKYFEEISLDAIRSRVDDPDWWFATRAMSAFVLVVAEALGVKYIVPTDISMVYGLLGE